MKYTPYFLETRKREDRKKIKLEWIEEVMLYPLHEETQKDGRVRLWGKVEDKYLRIILLSDRKTVHNAFFDRRFKGIHEN